MNIPLINDKIDYIYSYGVIHHTANPVITMKECYRLLKKDGIVLMYIYSCHENNLFKKIGVLLERKLMDKMTNLSDNSNLFICKAITPLLWLIFTVPSRILKFFGMNSLARKFPMNWGTSPFSIYPDVKDRLLASINYRFTRDEIKDLLCLTGLKPLKIVEDSTGIYLAAKK